LAVSREANDKSVEQGALHNLGVISYKQLAYAKAAENFSASLKLTQEIGARPFEADMLAHLAAVNIEEHHWKDVRRYSVQALQINREEHFPGAEAFSLSLVARSYFYQKKFKDARKYYELALARVQHQDLASTGGKLGVPQHLRIRKFG
jgi:tetratricopeptide (TPR) repeat protein